MSVPAPEVPPVTLDTRVGWVTIGEALELWEDAPGEEDENYRPLPRWLRAAWETLLDHAPRAVWADPEEIPEKVKLAQCLMARHLAARARSGNSSGYGTEEWQMSTYPLVLEAKDKMKRYRDPFRGMR